MEAVRTEGLSKSFGRYRALDNFTFSVNQGEIFGLVGPDGSGKTTTMRLLTSIMKPDSGEAWVMGKHTVREAEAIRDEIGYMSQRFGLYLDLTVMENLRFYADIYGVSRKEREKKTERLLAFSKLEPFKSRIARNLSGGMRQKLGLMCALIHTPKVLFLDEPTNGVDPLSRRDFWRILYQLLREGVTILVSTAYLDEAERCGRVALIQKGRLLVCDTPQNVKKLLRESILEIRTDRNRLAASMFREKLQLKAVNLFGGWIHVVTDAPEITSQAITGILREQGFVIEELRTIPPTLEDAFISMLTSQER